MVCHSAACTDDRARRMGLIFTTADWRGQICDGFRQPRIRPAKRSTEGALEPLACHLAFPVVGGLRIAPLGPRPGLPETQQATANSRTTATIMVFLMRVL